MLGRTSHFLRHSYFYIDQLDVIYTGSDKSFITPSKLFFFYIDWLDVIYTGPNMSFIAPSGLFIVGYCKDLIENILKEALLIISLLGLRISPIRVRNWST